MLLERFTKWWTSVIQDGGPYKHINLIISCFKKLYSNNIRFNMFQENSGDKRR